MTGSLFERETDKIDRMRPLRPRQLAAITGIKDAIRDGHKRIILQAPTGFGKTLTAAHIIAAALKKIGYAHVTLDLEGYRRGSLNEAAGSRFTPHTSRPDVKREA